MSVSLAPPMFLQFMNPNNSGSPAVGFQLFVYLAGTSTKASTWTDSTQTVLNANPLVLDANGVAALNASSGLWGDPSVAYKLVWAPANDTDPPTSPIRTVDNYYFPITAGAAAALQTFPKTTGETQAGVTPTNYGYPWGWVQRYGAVNDNGTTNNQAAFQAALNANAGYFPVVIAPVLGGSNNYFGGFTSALTIPGNSRVTFYDNAEMRWSSTTSGSGPAWNGPSNTTRPGFIIAGNNVRMEGKGLITGPSNGTFVSQEMGIVAVGNSASNMLTDVYIGPNLEMKWWGMDCIALQYVKRFWINACYLHDYGYGASHYLSCQDGEVVANRVVSNAPGSSGNAYGFSGSFYTQTTTAGSSRSDANPLCVNVNVRDNAIENNPFWSGIDFHGANECTISNNKIYNCMMGITHSAAQNTSGNSYAGQNNIIENNSIYAFKSDGSATTIATFQNGGITCVGANNTGGYLQGYKIRGNIVDGYGAATGGGITAYSIYTGFGDSTEYSGNIIRNWVGYGIYDGSGAAGSKSCIFRGNTFGPLVNLTNSVQACIVITGSATPPLIEGNVHHIASGNAAFAGCNVNTTTATLKAHNNDFTSATNAFVNHVNGVLAASFFVAQSEPLIVGTLGTATSTVLKGTTAFSSSTTAAVSFGVTLPNATYQVVISANANFTFWVTNKLTTGFTLNASSSVSSSIDWVVMQ